MATMLDYYDYDDQATLTCPNCNWSGPAEEGAREWYRELFDVSCPKCGKKLLIVSYPTDEETERAAASGHPKALSNMRFVEARRRFQSNFEKLKLKAPDQLPELDAEEMYFTWDFEETSEERSVIIKIGDRLIWKEPALWEGWSRFIEVKDILQAKYGSKFRALTPTKCSEMYLYGDDLSAPNKISFGPSEAALNYSSSASMGGERRQSQSNGAGGGGADVAAKINRARDIAFLLEERRRNTPERQFHREFFQRKVRELMLGSGELTTDAARVAFSEKVAEALTLLSFSIDQFPEYGDEWVSLDEAKCVDFVGEFLGEARALMHDLAPSHCP